MKQLLFTLAALSVTGVVTAGAASTLIDRDISFYMGANYVFNDGLGNDPAVHLGLLNEYFKAQLGGSYERFQIGATGQKIKIFELRGLLGLRKKVFDSTYVVYGVDGGYGFRSPNAANRTAPYSVGPMLGLDYQPNKRLLISFSLNPYSYQVQPTRTKKNSWFEAGTIGASYIM